MKKIVSILSAIVAISAFVLPAMVSAQAQGDVDTSSVTSCADLHNDLRYRSRDAATGGDVSLLQDFLQAKGYLNSEPTGYFGILTLKAVKDFQKDSGLSPTGFVGPLTRGKVKDMSCGGSTTVINKGCNDRAIYNYLTGERCSGTTVTPIIRLSNEQIIANLGQIIKARFFQTTSGDLYDQDFDLDNSGSILAADYSILSTLGTMSSADYDRVSGKILNAVKTRFFTKTGDPKFIAELDVLKDGKILADDYSAVKAALESMRGGCASGSYYNALTGLPCLGTVSVHIIVSTDLDADQKGGFIKAYIKGDPQNKTIGHWDLVISCTDGVFMSSKTNTNLCNTTLKNLGPYFDPTQDILILTGPTRLTSATSGNVVLSLIAYDVNGNKIGGDKDGVIFNGSSTPYITITAPNGGESWDINTQHEIRWTTNVSGTTQVYLQFADNSMCNIGTSGINGPMPAGSGIMYIVPASSGCAANTTKFITAGQYKAAVFINKPGDTSDLGTAHDFSDNYFSIVGTKNAAASCSITADKSTYTLGDTITYTWTSQNATYASWYQPTSGKDYPILPGDKLPASGSQKIIANVIGNVPVTLLASGLGGSTPCTVTVNVVYPTQSVVSVTSPTSGSVLTQGTQTSIRWAASGSGYDKYQIVVGNTTTNTERQLYDRVSMVDLIPITQTSFPWNIPDLLADFTRGTSFSADQIKNSFYLQVKTVRSDAAGGGYVSSSNRISFTVQAATPTPTPTATPAATNY
jgi:hypothetical protein